MPSVFISYARNDGADESLRLYDALGAHGIGAWPDNRIDPTADFTGEIENAINNATHVVVVITPDLKRADSFVRLEIGYALTQKKPIIPIIFPGGHRPITIINHIYINFTDWDAGFMLLLDRLKNPRMEETDPTTKREREIAYLQAIGQKYDHWRDLYTDLAATVRIEERKVKLKAAGQRIIEARYLIHQKIDHSLDDEKGKTVSIESLDELREGLRNYRRVALIGDPGSGKTTTLERLAYEYATTAAEETAESYRAPLPLFVRLGAYVGEGFTQFLEGAFGGLSLHDYLPNRVILLLDGLNEMPPAHHIIIDHWLRMNPDVAVIVSCRKLDYTERKLPLQRVDVQPLDLERIRLFMSNYLEADDRETLFWSLAGHDARRAWVRYQLQKDVTYREFFTGEDKLAPDWIPERKLLDNLRHSLRLYGALPDMLGVVTNPFLLQIVIEIFALSGEPPRNKGDLFTRFVALLMDERGKTAVRPDRAWIGEETQKHVLAVLAYRMQSEKTGTSVSAEFVRETFRLAAPDIDPALLLYFAVSASILVQSDTVRFSHQRLQEYFAAYKLLEDIKHGVQPTQFFSNDKWWIRTGWEEMFVFAGGMTGDSTEIVAWLTPLHPHLAYRVAKESGATCDERVIHALYEPDLNSRICPTARAEWGVILARRGDKRKGVGLRTDGLPDIDWCHIQPANVVDKFDEYHYGISYSFMMAKYPITYLQYQVFIELPDVDFAEWWSGGQSRRAKVSEFQSKDLANQPRVHVDWYQAHAFTAWIDHKFRQAGLIDVESKIRLPYTDEWEYAARGNDKRLYPWGNDYRVGHANLDEQTEGNGPDFLNYATAVGLYPSGASPFEIMDMCGNVYEWCADELWYSDLADKYFPEKGYVDRPARDRRGGCFADPVSEGACNVTFYSYPSHSDDATGFRLVCVPAYTSREKRWVSPG